MLPRLLVIDDLFGRLVANGRSVDRESLCANFLWNDVTDDAAANANRQKVFDPTAEVVFCRGQTPRAASVGSVVENDLPGALAVVRWGWTEAIASGRVPWTMVLLDLCFYTGRVTEDSHRRTPGMPEGRAGDDDPQSYFGLTLLDAIHREHPDLPIVILSSKSREEVSLEFSRNGALGFIDRSNLRGPELLQDALWNHGLLPEPDGEVVGNSLPVLLALREARRASRHHENVLIRGERGTGKELIARYLHHGWSQREETGGQRSEVRGQRVEEKGSSLVTVNSAVFTASLFASELFGIEAKTATGVDGKIGLIESAKGGDLFLDEIADMPPDVQAAMLRVLQERQITRVGGRQSIPVNVRFISATNADLEDPERGFRADLLDRLRTGGSIFLPPLRERMSDIPLLVDRFLREAEALRPGIRKREIAPEALDLLLAHDWPGNIRELRTTIFEASTRHPDVEHLVPDHLRIHRAGPSKPVVPHRMRAAGKTEHTAISLDELIATLERFEFDDRAATVWAGKLPRVQQAIGKLLVAYLRSGLQATRKPTPENPVGELRIHPALKLITGDATLTASKAADIIKKLVRTAAFGRDIMPDDPLVREAYDTALRLRPNTTRRAPSLPPIKDAT